MKANKWQHLQVTRQYWDNAAATFDDEPDHGLQDSKVREAWTKLLAKWLPPPPARILDAGCGTGSLCLVLTALGYDITGIDLSPEMVARAEQKSRAAGHSISFKVMDASDPHGLPQTFDVVLCRHLLWSLSEPSMVLHRWSDLLTPEGRLVLIEGYWHTGGGLHLQQLLAALPPSFSHVVHEDLSSGRNLWGEVVLDERYIVIAHR